MRQGGARWARSIALVCSLGGWTSLAVAQDLAPLPAAPAPVPEELAPSALVTPEDTNRAAAIEPPAVELGPRGTEAESSGSTELKYLLERVEVAGNRRTRTNLIKSFVPIDIGALLDVNNPEIEALRYRLLGTGWYDRVELRLKRGSQPGWVVLVIDVEERSTLVFQQLAAGVGWSVASAGTRASADQPSRLPEPYLGLAIAETNLLGTGRTLGGELLAARDQQGVALTFFTPVVRFSRWSLRTRASFVNGREYFGGDAGVVASSSCPEDDATETDCMVEADAAAVHYYRTGLGIGTARDVGSFTRLSLEWHADLVHVPRSGMPDAAIETRGRGVLAERPIDFSIERGFSKVSMLTVGLTYDKRDSAILPSSGTLAAFNGDLASGLTGSDYAFVRLQASYNHWFSLPWSHTIRLGAFVGAVFGSTPFFYKFFINDLTDLQPSRILGLNLDHRPAPNLLHTSIAQMRQEELAGRVDTEYVWPLVRGRRKFVKGADAFLLFGVYGLADPKDLRVPMPGYEGMSRIPIDLTFDAGVRLDTRIGVFQIGLSKLLWLTVK
jgi:outer membrane protein insertion porin family